MFIRYEYKHKITNISAQTNRVLSAFIANFKLDIYLETWDVLHHVITGFTHFMNFPLFLGIGILYHF